MSENTGISSTLQYLKFVNQIKLSGKRLIINTESLFIAGKGGNPFVTPLFEKAVHESNSDSIYIVPRMRTYDIFKNTRSIRKKDAQEKIEEPLIDLSTYGGREEAKIRFKCLAALLLAQKAGNSGELSNKRATIIGWVKLCDGTICTLYVYWHMEPGFSGKWYCHADSLNKTGDNEYWKEGKFFLKKHIPEKAKGLL